MVQCEVYVRLSKNSGNKMGMLVTRPFIGDRLFAVANITFTISLSCTQGQWSRVVAVVMSQGIGRGWRNSRNTIR